MKQLSIGSIGSGMIVHEILSAMVNSGHAVIQAVYSRSQIRASELQAKFHAHRAYTDLNVMMLDPSINCIYVASPNSLHYLHAKLALHHGKHVICEKPFCPTAANAKELFQLAEENGLMIVEAVTNTFLPNYTVLKKLLPQIGKVHLVLCNYTQYSSRYGKLLTGEHPNVFSREFCGGSLQDLNYYNAHLCISLFGMPTESSYCFNAPVGYADTSGILTLRYPDFICQCTAAKDSCGASFVLIEGENGYIQIPDSANSMQQIHLVSKEFSQTFSEQSHENRWQYEMDALLPLILHCDKAALEEKKQFTLQTIETIETARKAAGLFFPADT